MDSQTFACFFIPHQKTIILIYSGQCLPIGTLEYQISKIWYDFLMLLVLKKNNFGTLQKIRYYFGTAFDFCENLSNSCAILR